MFWNTYSIRKVRIVGQIGLCGLLTFITYSKDQVSLHVDDADASQIVKSLLDSKGYSIKGLDKLTGRVTLHVDNAPVDTVLVSILAQLNADFRKNANEYILESKNIQSGAEFIPANMRHASHDNFKHKSKSSSYDGHYSDNIMTKKIPLNMDPALFFVLLGHELGAVPNINLYTENSLIGSGASGGGFGQRSPMLGNRSTYGYGRMPGIGNRGGVVR